MTKLNKKMQDEVKNAASGFDPFADVAAHFVLKDVDTTRSGPKGPYWSWEFECIEEEPLEFIVNAETGETKKQNAKGRKVWNNTSLGQAWSLKQTFDAFGVGVDTDTDELIGKPVKLVLSSRVIQEGQRKGQLSNNVDRVVPADEDVVKLAEKRAKDQKEMSEIF